MIMMELRVAVMGTKATIAEKLYVKVDPNNKIKLRFMLESSRALMLWYSDALGSNQWTGA